MSPLKQYKYGEDVIVNGQNVGKAMFDTATGKPLTAPTTAPTAPTDPVVTPTATTPFQFSPNPVDTRLTEAGKLAEDYYKSQANSVIDEDQIRRDALAQMQAEIDATNRIYVDKLQRAQTQGAGRLGTATAVSARRGLAGSDFGEAQYQNVEGQNQQIYSSIEDEKRAVVSALLNKAKESGAAAIAEKRKAKEEGLDSYLKSLSTASESSKKRASELAKQILLSGVAYGQFDKNTLEQAAQSAGVSIDEIKRQYDEQKKTKDDADKKIADEATQLEFENQLKLDTLNRPVSLSEGGALIDPKTGKVIASRAKTYAPGTGGGTVGTTIDGVKLSPAAQNIVNLVMAGSGTIDDYIKGSSNAAQSLRNEVLSGLQATKGKSDTAITGIKEARDIAQRMLDKTDYKKFGQSARFGGKLTTGYGDMQTRALQMNALLAKDNLGLLKGAMSDKDLAFIEAMSGGIGSDIIFSEAEAKYRMEDIVKKLDKRLESYGQETSGTGTKSTPEDESLLNQYGL